MGGRGESQMEFQTLEDIQSLIQDKIEESTTLEYKQELDSDNKEIAKDISALANTEGGTLIYGIQTKDKIPTGINWLVGNGIEERIQNIINTTINPRLKGTQVTRLLNPDHSSEAVYIVNILKSLNAPHMVYNRYYIRRGSVSSPMEDIDVRSAMFGKGRTAAIRHEIDQNSELAERTRKLIEQIYVFPEPSRATIALIPLHTDAWNAVIASGLLYSLEDTVAEKLVEAYRRIHEVNSIIGWINMKNPNVAATPVEPSSAKRGTYLPRLLMDTLPRLNNLLKEIASLLPG